MRHTTPERAAPRARRLDEQRPSPSRAAAEERGERRRSNRSCRRPTRRNTPDTRTLAAAAFIIAMVLLATVLGMRTPDPAPMLGQDASSAPLTAVAATIQEELGDPTPFFAAHGSLQLRSPIPPAAITEIGFHQASGSNALPMTTTLPDADIGEAKGSRGTGGSIAAQTKPGDSMLQGSVLRMWRSNRTGAPDTAADIGAAPGTIVLSPVTGEITEVKLYWLYGEHEDYEIHIRPDGWDDIDVVIIHVSDVSVAAGDRVIGGVTQIATVRRLSDRVNHQLGEYTVDGGDHIHVQLNRIDPGQSTYVEGS